MPVSMASSISSVSSVSSVFVTVGTTSFDRLVQVIDDVCALEALQKMGYTKCTIQIGRGGYVPRLATKMKVENVNKVAGAEGDISTEKQSGADTDVDSRAVLPKGFTFEYYRFKPSLFADINSASLVISHAGAGTIMESLRNRRKLLVVINNELMHNHQVRYQLLCQGDQYHLTSHPF